MNSLVSILEISTNINECLIAARSCWTQFSSTQSYSPEEVDLLQKIYFSALNCADHFSQKMPPAQHKETFNELVIHLLNIIHAAESPSVPFPLSPKHFPILTQLITVASNQALAKHFLKTLLGYLHNNYLRSLAISRLLTLSIEAAKNQDLSILQTLCETDNMKACSIRQLYDLRDALLSLIPHAMLYVSPPSPVVQLVTKVDQYLKSVENSE